MKRTGTVISGLVLAAFLVVLSSSDQIVCVPPDPGEQICQAVADCEGLPHAALTCDAEWSCEDGACVWDCVPEEPLPTGCYENDDCAFNQTCEITNDCCSPPGCTDPAQPCPDVCVPCGQCVDMVSECLQDSDCGIGYACEEELVCPPCVYANPPCKAPCYAFGECVQVESECLQDSDCAWNQECKTTELCPYCVNNPPYCDQACLMFGECVDIESQCINDKECPPGMICEVESYCPPCVNADPPCLAPCWAAGSCVPGPEPKCITLDPYAFGVCAMFMGYGFDGKECVGISGCGCQNQCDNIFPSMEECHKNCF